MGGRAGARTPRCPDRRGVLAATAVAAIGVVGFVGLVAPHTARALVGSRHLWVLPTSALLGAAPVSIADTIGRTILAPGRSPAVW